MCPAPSKPSSPGWNIKHDVAGRARRGGRPAVGPPPPASWCAGRARRRAAWHRWSPTKSNPVASTTGRPVLSARSSTGTSCLERRPAAPPTPAQPARDRSGPPAAGRRARPGPGACVGAVRGRSPARGAGSRRNCDQVERSRARASASRSTGHSVQPLGRRRRASAAPPDPSRRSVVVVRLPEAPGAARGVVPGLDVAQPPLDLGLGVGLPVRTRRGHLRAGQRLRDAVGPAGVGGVGPASRSRGPTAARGSRTGRSPAAGGEQCSAMALAEPGSGAGARDIAGADFVVTVRVCRPATTSARGAVARRPNAIRVWPAPCRRRRPPRR